MTIALNDLFRVNMVGECFGQRIMLTHSYYVSQVAGTIDEAAGSFALLNGITAVGTDVWETSYLNCLPPEYTLVRATAQKVGPVRYRYYQLFRGQIGLHATSTETANQSAALEFHTALAGRKDVGVKKIGPLPQGVPVQVDGLLTNAYKGLLDTLGNFMLADIVSVAPAVTFTPCLIHDEQQVAFTKVIGRISGETVNGMRRRTVGRGI